MTDYGAAERLGSTLGVMAKHGLPALRRAIAALREGKATSQQQSIVADFLDAVTR